MKLHEQGKYKNKSTSPVVKMNIYMFIHKIKCSERKQIVFEMALLWHIIRNTSVFRCTQPDLWKKEHWRNKINYLRTAY